MDKVEPGRNFFQLALTPFAYTKVPLLGSVHCLLGVLLPMWLRDMIDVRFLQTDVGGTRICTPKAVIRVALNKGRTLPLLQLAPDLHHNRKTRRNVGRVRAA